MQVFIPVPNMKKEYAFVYFTFMLSSFIFFTISTLTVWLILEVLLVGLTLLKLVALQRLAGIFMIPKGHTINGRSKLNGHYLSVTNGELLCKSKSPIHYRFGFCRECLAAAAAESLS